MASPPPIVDPYDFFHRMNAVRHSFAARWLGIVGLALALAGVTVARAAEVIPAKPARYFNDYAKIVSGSTAQQLDKTLEDFERATSSQIVVATFPKMESDSSIEDYAQRIYKAWGVGQKGTNNGAILLVFVQNRTMRIHTGYGLEGALPDATAKRIIEDEIKPRFRQGDFNGGLTAGVNAMLQATRGEYRGSGKTVQDIRRQKHSTQNFGSILFFLFIFFLIVMRVLGGIRRGIGFSRRGRWASPGWGWGSGGWSSGGWSSSGGGGGGWSGGGGGFSGGGGDSGGGGASGSW